jgi:hypothetical protein
MLKWNIRLDDSQYRSAGDYRFARYIEIDVEDYSRTVIAFYPTKTKGATGRMFIDYRFEVFASDTLAPTLAVMMQDAIIGRQN